MKRYLAAVVAVLLVATATTFAQKKDLAGSWTFDTEKSGTTQGPPALLITLTDKEFTIKMGTMPEPFVFKLDGTETTLKNGNKAKAEWKGDKLVATMTTTRGPESITFSREGAWLVQEAPGGRGPAKLYFKKTPAK